MVFIGIVYSSCMYSSSLSTASKGSPARPLVGLGAASAAAPRFLHRLAILHTPNSLHQSTNLQFEVLNNYYWDCCLSVFFSRVLYLYILKAAAPLYYNFLGVSTSLKKKICGLYIMWKCFCEIISQRPQFWPSSVKFWRGRHVTSLEAASYTAIMVKVLLLEFEKQKRYSYELKKWGSHPASFVPNT